MQVEKNGAEKCFYSILSWLFDDKRFPYVDTQIHPTMETANKDQVVVANIKYMPPQ